VNTVIVIDLLRKCKQCGKWFNGWAKLYDHKLQAHPKWNKAMIRTLDLQIAALRKREIERLAGSYRVG